LNVALENGLLDNLFTGFNQRDNVNVVITNNDVVVPPHGDLNTVVQGHPGHESLLDGFVPGQGSNLAQTVGKTFKVMSGKQLLHHVQTDFATPYFGEIVPEDVIPHPEWIVSMEIVVVGVQVDVFSEVPEFVVAVEVHALVINVLIDHIDVLVRLLDAVELAELGVKESSLHLELVGLLDDISTDEVVRVDFVGRRQDDAAAVLAVAAGHSERVDKHALVQVETHPAGSLEEGGEVLGVVEQVEGADDLLHLAVDVESEDLATRKHADLHAVDKTLHDVGFLK
ncbi:unnamed protein product, partial [Plutella xylostella]